MRHPPLARACSHTAVSSSNGIDVPVGLDGLAISTALVRSVHAPATDAASSWYRASAVVGTDAIRPPNASISCRFAG